MDPKQIAIAVLAKKPEQSGESEDSTSEALEAAAGNLLAAQRSGNASDYASSLREFIQLCRDT